MRLLIGIICNDFARVSIFTASAIKTQEHLLKSGIDSTAETLIGGDWCGARNTIARMAIDEGYDALWFMDDDHAWAPTLPEQLLSWNLPLVVPICLIRTPPFTPVTFTDEVDAANGKYLPAYLPDMPNEGLIELAAGGCAGMLIRREVLEKVPEPWFEYGHVSEDLRFCEKAKEAGFTLYADLSARLGHVTTAVVWPANEDDGSWVTGLTIGGSATVTIPFDSFYPEEEVQEPGPSPETEFVDPFKNALDELAKPLADRIEMFVDDDGRWHARAVTAGGMIIEEIHPQFNEQNAERVIADKWPSLPIFLIKNEGEDSTWMGMGPSPRLWTKR